jgi:RNA polymerase sigma-70 factor, ECF subfamily
MGSGPSDEFIAELFVQAERTAGRLVGRDLAEDVASEAVIRALVRWSKVSGHAHAWVTRVATNLAIDLLRKQGRSAPESTASSSSSFEGDTVQRLDIVRSLRLLPRRQRQVVVLHYLGGFTDGEVSAVLGLSVPTVKTHLGRALSALRDLDGAVREESDASADPT